MDFMAEHRRLESYGVALLERTIATLNSVIPDDPSLPDAQAMHRSWVQGPEFNFADSAILFSGRRGSGPFYAVWDTNILLDYFEHGSRLWSGRELPTELDDEYLSDLECLQLVMALWAIRDIRFVVLRESVDDAKKKLSQERRLLRRNAFDEFACALVLTPDGDSGHNISRHGLLALPRTVFDDAMNNVPRGLDRRMVSAACRYGAHAYVTRDKKVLRAAPHFRSLGLSIISPGDLFESLLAAGAFNCVLNPQLAYWPLPDQQRVAHLIRALPDYDL